MRISSHPSSDLLESVDLLRLDASRRLGPDTRVELGQFMTPSDVARILAGLFEARGGRSISLLDPGAGVGSLTAAFIASLLKQDERPATVSVTAFELDRELATQLRETLGLCADACAKAGIKLCTTIIEEDFLVAGPRRLSEQRAGRLTPFDCVIMNPPYRKIQSGSPRYKALRDAGFDASNLYSAFLSVATQLLKPQGELVAITPRSFCNGPYFRAFRQSFLSEMALQTIHVFETRDRAFKDDAVLQENLIFRAIRAHTHPGPVTIQTSSGPTDQMPVTRSVPYAMVVRPEDSESVIHIVPDAMGDRVVEMTNNLPGDLSLLGLTVSTGRVVDFRASDYLRRARGRDTIPLLYPGHFSQGWIEWPNLKSKKPNALVLGPKTASLTVPNGVYVLVKRFSAKEEVRRLVAAVSDPDSIPAEFLGIENHLNYFHQAGRPLPMRLAIGLAAWLNSTLADEYFRQFSGHTQVNASDLRRMKYPSQKQLEQVGKIVGQRHLAQSEIDDIIAKEIFSMANGNNGLDPVRAKKRIDEALGVLRAIGLPRAQQNERSALTLLALVGLRPNTPWAEAASPLRGITEMMLFFKEHYGKEYAPNTRETVRRFTVHQFLEAGVVTINPDAPERPTNSPRSVYQIDPDVLLLLKAYGTPAWAKVLDKYLASAETLRQRYAQERTMARLPLSFPTGQKITLSPGGQNILVKEIIEQFCPRFTPGAIPIYVGDTDNKWALFDKTTLGALGVVVNEHGKMPDVVVYFKKKNWLVLIEAVTSHGPMNPKRHGELKALFANSKAGLVFVTAFLDRKSMVKYLGEISWETEVWVADAPSHMIHFNGKRFLGPYEAE